MNEAIVTGRRTGEEGGSAMDGTGTRYLEVGGGRIAYDDTGGDGPLVVCFPGIGDLRASYRFLRPPLVEAGYRVATADLRGLGESSTGWSGYTDADVAGDVLALVRHLGAGPAFLVGNSAAGGAVAYAAAVEPAAVAGLALLSPFVRDVPQTFGQRFGLRAITLPVVGPGLWTYYYATALYPRRKPDDLDGYRKELLANLREPGRFEAVRSMFLRPGHAAVEARLGEVGAPALVVVGTKDPDFPDPAAEARLVAERLGSRQTRVLAVEGAGHYPHAEVFEEVGPAVVRFLNGVSGEGERR